MQCLGKSLEEVRKAAAEFSINTIQQYKHDYGTR